MWSKVKWKSFGCVWLFATPLIIQSMKFSSQNTSVGSLSFLQGNLPNPGIESRSPTLQANSLPAEAQGKPKTTGVDNLFLLQQIFPTQESNWGVLHCRQILYQLSYQRSHKLKCAYLYLGFPPGSAGKESTCEVGDLGSIPGLESSHREGTGYPLQYSGLENSGVAVLDMTE